MNGLLSQTKSVDFKQNPKLGGHAMDKVELIK